MLDLPSELILIIMQASYPLDAMQLKYTCKYLSDFTPTYVGCKYKIGNVFEISSDLGELDSAQLSLFGHINLIKRSKHLNECLMGACVGGQRSVIDLVISLGANDFIMALVCACNGGHKNIVQMIMDISLHKTCTVGYNDGLYGACRGKQLDLIEWMIELGADNLNYGLGGACDGGHMDIAVMMVELGARGFNTGLNSACCGGHIELAQYMVQLGADKFDEALERAKIYGHKDLIEWLSGLIG